MKSTINPTFYGPLEEKINIISHLVGFILSIVALVLLATYSSIFGNATHIVSMSIFGLSLLILYAASTIYHGTKTPSLRKKLQIFDHASIYILIAGTYTPFALLTLGGAIGWTIFGVVWGLAIIGVILKFFFIGRYTRLSTLMYVFMGWIVLFAINTLIENLEFGGLVLLVAGGLSYTIGAILFSLEKLKFNHAIFHLFVLGGSICHFFSVFLYLIP